MSRIYHQYSIGFFISARSFSIQSVSFVLLSFSRHHWRMILSTTSYRHRRGRVHAWWTPRRILFLYHGWQTRVAPETLARIASYSVSPIVAASLDSSFATFQADRLILPWRSRQGVSFFKNSRTVETEVVERRKSAESRPSYRVFQCFYECFAIQISSLWCVW